MTAGKIVTERLRIMDVKVRTHGGAFPSNLTLGTVWRPGETY